MERTYEAPSNEAPHMILGYHWGRSVTYLLFPFLFPLWDVANPRTTMPISTICNIQPAFSTKYTAPRSISKSFCPFQGFMLETNPLELIYFGPTNVSQVLSPFSASPPKVLLSGFRSRCHIVVNGAFPAHRVQQGLAQLVALQHSWL